MAGITPDHQQGLAQAVADHAARCAWTGWPARYVAEYYLAEQQQTRHPVPGPLPTLAEAHDWVASYLAANPEMLTKTPPTIDELAERERTKGEQADARSKATSIRAAQAYKAGRYDEALTLLDEAEQLSPRPADWEARRRKVRAAQAATRAPAPAPVEASGPPQPGGLWAVQPHLQTNIGESDHLAARAGQACAQGRYAEALTLLDEAERVDHRVHRAHASSLWQWRREKVRRFAQQAGVALPSPPPTTPPAPRTAERAEALVETGRYFATRTVWGTVWVPALADTGDTEEPVTAVSLLVDEPTGQVSHYVLEDGRAIPASRVQLQDPTVARNSELLTGLAGALTVPDWRSAAAIDHDRCCISLAQLGEAAATIRLSADGWQWFRSRLDNRSTHQLPLDRPVAKVAGAIRASLRPTSAATALAASLDAATAMAHYDPPLEGFMHDLAAFLRGLPDVWSAYQHAIGQLADRLTYQPVDRAVIDELDYLRNGLGQLATAAQSLEGVYRTANQRDWDRVEQPRPGERYADSLHNRDSAGITDVAGGG